MVNSDSECGTRSCRLVGPVAFEPTTSGPDLLGGTSAPGSPSITGLWYPLGGVNPLDQARRRPPLLPIECTGILPFRRRENRSPIATRARHTALNERKDATS